MNSKKKAIILFIICTVILISGIIYDVIFGKSYLVEIDYNSAIEKLENDESYVILFSQTTCNHCIKYKPKLEKVAKEYKIEIYYIDIDLLSKKHRDELGKIYNFDSTPVTIFIKNGEETSSATRIVGDASSEKIINKFKSNGFVK